MILTTGMINNLNTLVGANPNIEINNPAILNSELYTSLTGATILVSEQDGCFLTIGASILLAKIIVNNNTLNNIDIPKIFIGTPEAVDIAGTLSQDHLDRLCSTTTAKDIIEFVKVLSASESLTTIQMSLSVDEATKANIAKEIAPFSHTLDFIGLPTFKTEAAPFNAERLETVKEAINAIVASDPLSIINQYILSDELLKAATTPEKTTPSSLSPASSPEDLEIAIAGDVDTQEIA